MNYLVGIRFPDWEIKIDAATPDDAVRKATASFEDAPLEAKDLLLGATITVLSLDEPGLPILLYEDYQGE